MVKSDGPLQLRSSPEVLRGLVSVLLGDMTDKATGLGTSRRENTLESVQETVEHHLDETDHIREVYSRPTLISVPEALKVLSAFDPKPCNSTLWVKDPAVKTAFSKFASRREVFAASLTCFTARLSIPVHVMNTLADILQSVCMEPFQTIPNVWHPSELDTLHIEAQNHTPSTGFSFPGWRNYIRRIQ